jgi:hypothetical protein
MMIRNLRGKIGEQNQGGAYRDGDKEGHDKAIFFETAGGIAAFDSASHLFVGIIGTRLARSRNRSAVTYRSNLFG